METSVSKAAKYLSWVLAGVVLLLPFHALFTTWLGSNFGHYDAFKIWKEIILIAALPVAGWIVYKTPRLRKNLQESWLVWLIAAYILLNLMLGAWAYSVGNVNKEALAYALIINLRFLVLFLVCYIAAAKSAYLKKNWKPLLLIPAGLVIIFGLFQRFILPTDFLTHFGYGPDTIPAVQTVDNDIANRRIQSTLRGANPLGAYLILVITAMFGLFTKSNSMRAISLASAFIVLFYSYSRSAWIGVIVSLGLVLWLSYGYKNKLRWVLIASMSLLVIASGALLLLRTSEQAQDTLLHTSNDTPGSSVTSNEARAIAIKNAAIDVAKHPIGDGPGTAGPASVRNNNQPKIAENYFLQIGQEVGVIGMAVFIAIVILAGLGLWELREELLPRILLASLLGLTAVNMLSHGWTDDTISYLWWGFAGVALAPAILESKNKRNGKKTNQAK